MSTIGMSTGPQGLGLYQDRVGNYNVALLVMAGLMVAASACCLALGPYRFAGHRPQGKAAPEASAAPIGAH